MGIPNTEKISGNDLAGILGITGRQVLNLHHEGVLAQTAKGKYDLHKSVQAYIHYCKHGKVQSAHTEAKGRWESARARKAELEAARLAGDSLPRADVAVVMNELAVEFKGAVEALAGRHCEEFAAEENAGVIRQTQLRAARGILEQLADRLQRFGSPAPSGGTTKTTTGKNRSRVGKSKPSVAEGKRRARTVQK